MNTFANLNMFIYSIYFNADNFFKKKKKNYLSSVVIAKKISELALYI